MSRLRPRLASNLPAMRDRPCVRNRRDRAEARQPPLAELECCRQAAGVAAQMTRWEATSRLASLGRKGSEWTSRRARHWSKKNDRAAVPPPPWGLASRCVPRCQFWSFNRRTGPVVCAAIAACVNKSCRGVLVVYDLLVGPFCHHDLLVLVAPHRRDSGAAGIDSSEDGAPQLQRQRRWWQTEQGGQQHEVEPTCSSPGRRRRVPQLAGSRYNASFIRRSATRGDGEKSPAGAAAGQKSSGLPLGALQKQTLMTVGSMTQKLCIKGACSTCAWRRRCFDAPPKIVSSSALRRLLRKRRTR